MPGPGQGFDVNAARQAGYSDDEILSHLTQTRKFDVQSAQRSGYSATEIVNYLSGSPAVPSTQLPWLPNGVPSPSVGGGVPRPQVNMQQSLLGHRETSDPDIARIDRSIDQYGTLAPTPQDALTGAAVAGTVVAAPAVARPVIAAIAARPALSALAKKWGVKALEGAGAGLGWQLYHDLHTALFSADTEK